MLVSHDVYGNVLQFFALVVVGSIVPFIFTADPDSAPTLAKNLMFFDGAIIAAGAAWIIINSLHDGMTLLVPWLMTPGAMTDIKILAENCFWFTIIVFPALNLLAYFLFELAKLVIKEVKNVKKLTEKAESAA